MNKLVNLIDKGWNITIENQIKRMDVGNGREFVARVCWEAKICDYVIRSRRKGFEMAIDCINDCVLKLTKYEKSK